MWEEKLCRSRSSREKSTFLRHEPRWWWRNVNDRERAAWTRIVLRRWLKAWQSLLPVEEELDVRWVTSFAKEADTSYQESSRIATSLPIHPTLAQFFSPSRSENLIQLRAPARGVIFLTNSQMWNLSSVSSRSRKRRIPSRLLVHLLTKINHWNDNKSIKNYGTEN